MRMAWKFKIDCSYKKNKTKNKKKNKQQLSSQKKKKTMVEFRIFYQIFPLFYNVVDSQLPMIE